MTVQKPLKLLTNGIFAFERYFLDEILTFFFFVFRFLSERKYQRYTYDPSDINLLSRFTRWWFLFSTRLFFKNFFFLYYLFFRHWNSETRSASVRNYRRPLFESSAGLLCLSVFTKTRSAVRKSMNSRTPSVGVRLYDIQIRPDRRTNNWRNSTRRANAINCQQRRCSIQI